MRRFPLASVWLLLCLTSSHGQRFLDSWTFLPDSLPRLGDQILSHASTAIRRMIPEASRTLDTVMTTHNKRTPSPERETEGEDDAEVVIGQPAKTPDPHPTWFRPLVPFSFSFGLLTPWWEGPNVCTELDEVDESERQDVPESSPFTINFETTRCIPSDSSYVCTKKIQSNGLRRTIVMKRNCCHGYIRRTDGRPGCTAFKMDNLIRTMKTLEVEKFEHWIESAGGLIEKLAQENCTVFAPSNEAVTDYEDETEDNEISAIDPVKRSVDVSSLVRGHTVEGFVNADHTQDEQLLDTLNDDVKIRINKYHHTGHEITTANCIKISGKNNFATNGIVHLVSSVLPQPIKSIGEIIEADDQFTTLRKLLEESGLMEELKKGGQSWTLLAPTDDAFRKLPRGLKGQMESGKACVQNLLRQHLVRGTVCTSSVIHQEVRVKNVLGNLLHLNRDGTEKLQVDGGIIDVEDTMATNGVLHALETVLVPQQAQSLLKSLQDDGREDILRFMEIADLVSDLEEMRNVTLFVPSKEAFQNLPNGTLQEMERNPELMKKMLLNHMVGSQVPTGKFAHDRNFETLNGNPVNIKLHELFPGIVTGASVQCARITSHDHQACGALIHKINKVLMPAEGSIVEVLRGMKDDHSTILRMLEVSPVVRGRLEREGGPFTLLAPTDEAFQEAFDSQSLKGMLENETRAEQILKMHILTEALCCNSIRTISPFHRQFVRTLDGQPLTLHRNSHSHFLHHSHASRGVVVKFGRATAQHCDIQAKNGLIHSIDKVILPNRRPTANVFDIELW